MKIALIIIAAILGSVPFGLLISLGKGVDPRTAGSGNIGATNVLRVVGKREGFLTLILDILKGFLPTYVAHLAFKSESFSLTVGLFAILGHCFSPFLRLKGGKGVATSLGVITVVNPLLTAIAVTTFIVVFLIKRIVSLSSITASCVTLIASIFMLSEKTSKFIVLLIVVTVVIKHKDNIERLIKGEEKKLMLRKEE